MVGMTEEMIIGISVGNMILWLNVKTVEGGCISGLLTQIGVVFFFQAEDGIRDADVTGVQTCALPIYDTPSHPTSGLSRLAPTFLIPRGLGPTNVGARRDKPLVGWLGVSSVSFVSPWA